MEERLELTRQAVTRHFWYRGFRTFVHPAIAEALGTRRHLRLLDCGSGTGDNLAFLATYGSAVGMDLSLPGVALARAAGHGGVSGDVRRLPFGSGSFDVATSFDVLQQIDADGEAVREMARVLRPGGVVVLTLAALEILHGDHNVVWDEKRRYTPETARALVRQAGLTPERVSFLFATLFPILLVSRTVQRLTRRWRRLNETADISVPPAPVNAVLSAVVLAEASLARIVPMPFGSTLLVIARKP
ncbi:MAG: class I SAM-dependent methyltransferase [Vicinamibacterales bacterium]